jgi:hypothetical protein
MKSNQGIQVGSGDKQLMSASARLRRSDVVSDEQTRLDAIAKLPTVPLPESSPLPTPESSNTIERPIQQVLDIFPGEEQEMKNNQAINISQGSRTKWVVDDGWGQDLVVDTRVIVAPGVQGEQENLKVADEQIEGGLSAFFTSLVDSASAVIDGAVAVISEPIEELVPALLGAALLPFVGPVIAGVAAVGVVSMKTGVSEETIEKIVQPVREEQLEESRPQSKDAGEQQGESESLKQAEQWMLDAALERVIQEALSKDRKANEDLKQFFIDHVMPNIQSAIKQVETAKETHINIKGPVGTLIVGDNNRNIIKQIFRRFLPGETDQQEEKVQEVEES